MIDLGAPPWWPGGGGAPLRVKLCCVGYGHGRTFDNLAGPTMSLWTPGGEHTPGEGSGTGQPDRPGVDDLTADERAHLEAMQAEMAEVREQLLGAPASVVLANHAMGMYELAAIHLTAEVPKLAEASLAIDALAAMVERLEGRLGDPEPTLRDALAQLRAAYLEVRDRTSAGGAPEA